MVIACTRCGAKEDGEILTAPIAFAFKHASGCGHGVGPLVVLRGQTKKLEIKDVKNTKTVESVMTSGTQTLVEEIKVESEPKEKKSIKEKIKVFGKQDKKE